jgi:glycosyltransferase involved in cell wall biosynthesis
MVDELGKNMVLEMGGAGAVVSFPGNMDHAQHVALSLAEINCLRAYVTSFAFRSESKILKGLALVPGASGLVQTLGRRSLKYIPEQLVQSAPFWELLRTAALKAGLGDVLVDKLWDIASLQLDARVAARFIKGSHSVHAFEYTALKSFQEAHRHRVACVLHLPSLDSLQFEQLQRREKESWPELRGRDDDYFTKKFAERYERRRAEIELAHVIVANSSITARSHVEAGADAKKVRVVPLAAPPPISRIEWCGQQQFAPLKVIWAGSFSLRKGAHYLLEAWRRLKADGNAHLDVFGQVVLPREMQDSGFPDGLKFHGSVPRERLFAAFESADVLVFPTLSDGFGMVVMEAFSRGLPVITTQEAGAADLVSPENGLIVEAGNATALAHTLQWCLDNRQALQGMREGALQTAKSRQWRHFRADLLREVDAGLLQAGFAANSAMVKS